MTEFIPVVFGSVNAVMSGMALFILSDLRKRIERLEDNAMKRREDFAHV